MMNYMGNELIGKDTQECERTYLTSTLYDLEKVRVIYFPKSPN